MEKYFSLEFSSLSSRKQMNGKGKFQRINEQKVLAIKIPFQQRPRVKKLPMKPFEFSRSSR